MKFVIQKNGSGNILPYWCVVLNVFFFIFCDLDETISQYELCVVSHETMIKIPDYILFKIQQTFLWHLSWGNVS